MASKHWVVLGWAFLLACGGSQTKAETPESESAFDELEPAEEKVVEAPQEPPPSGRVSEMGRRPPPIPEAWELKQSDCDALEKKYEQLLLAVEIEKLEKRKLNEKQRATAEKNVQITAKEGARNWLRACNDIVGTVQVKGRWDCAYKATTLDRFKGCMDGKFDAEFRDQ